MKTKEKPSEKKRIIFGKPSWRFISSAPEAPVAEKGGLQVPVIFTFRKIKIPYYAISPGREEKLFRTFLFKNAWPDENGASSHSSISRYTCQGSDIKYMFQVRCGPCQY
jgi:hypothetical protein